MKSRVFHKEVRFQYVDSISGCAYFKEMNNSFFGHEFFVKTTELDDLNISLRDVHCVALYDTDHKNAELLIKHNNQYIEVPVLASLYNPDPRRRSK